MTNKEAKGRLESFIDTFNICKEHDNSLVAVSISKEDIQAFTQAIKALETVSCIKEKCAYCPHCENCDVDDETLEIKALEQKEKTGKWIVHPKGIYAHLVCNKCLSNAPYDCQTKYCPNCGARMVSE